jgi:hypothetical protein
MQRNAMEKFFYKLVDNTDFVWKVENVSNDPYKENTLTFRQYVCNKRVFNPVIFESIADFEQSEQLLTYKEIIPDQLNNEKSYYDNVIGLVHADDYWNNLHAFRHVNCLNELVPIVFDSSDENNPFITNADRENYLKLQACGAEKGHEIYDCAFQYFKTLWDFDAHFEQTQLDTIEKFLPTLELQAIYLSNANTETEASACIVFRPSWDPEHGLAVVLNLVTMKVQLYED